MITRMNHVSVFVLNHYSAYEFYVNKLGFKVNTNTPMGPGMRWLTVYPPEQPELEIALMLVDEGSTDEGRMFNPDSGRAMRELVRKGTFGLGVFECDNLLVT
jgi:catechol 2,3-dioxygenase-like lactoylglutathione lyase family enzyme